MVEKNLSGGEVKSGFRSVIYKITAMAAILMFFYILYLAALIKDYPKMKKEINTFHDVVAGESSGPAEFEVKNNKKTGIENFMVSGEGVKEKIEKIKEYKKLLSNRNMEIAGFISGLKSGGNKVKEEEERLKKMIDDILGAYERYRGQAGEEQ